MGTVRVGFSFSASILNREDSELLLSDLDILVFPELVDGGYAALSRGCRPHTPDDELVRLFKHASRLSSCTIIAGSLFFHHETPKPTNTSLVFRSGRICLRYDKIHLFKPTGDHKYFQSGELAARTFAMRTRAGRVRGGVVICYDLRFPELIRAMTLRGMELLFVPARWPYERDLAWQTLLRARAIENQIFVLGCNATDKEGGSSYVFDPLGNLVFTNRLSKADLWTYFDLNLPALQQARKLHDNLRDARFLRRFFR